jgi:hypothetical protein
MLENELKELILNMPIEVTNNFQFDIINKYFIISHNGGTSSVLVSQISHIDIDNMVCIWCKFGHIFCYISTGNMDVTFGDI